ncbi:MAG: ParB/RepB/Spo0J family partition protein [Clostridia bacterium]|nr:ParB/RepB/Spo0J family partition protein [Clostridia bacterium]
MLQIPYENRKLYELDLSTLQPDPNQPRKYFSEEALEELANSIKEHGILQPILFRVNGNGQNIVIAGERRFRAAQKAGLIAIPAIYMNGKSAEISLVENILRQDLTVIEEAEALKRMQDVFRYTHDDLSRVLGMSRTMVTEILSINNLPDEVKDDCRHDTKCSKSKLIEIAREKSPKKMLSLYQKVKTLNLSRDELKKLAKGRKKQEGDPLIIKAVQALTKKLEKPGLEMEPEKMEGLKAELEKLSTAIKAFWEGLDDKVIG